MVEDAIVYGTNVVQGAFLWPTYPVMAKNHGTSWYRSKEKKGGQHPFTSYMLNKKWTLEEEFNNHMLRLQQVTVCSLYSREPEVS